MADDRYDESYHEKVGLQIEIGKLISAANYAKINGDADWYLEIVQTLFHTIPPHDRAKTIKKFEKELAMIPRGIKKHQPHEVPSPLEWVKWQSKRKTIIMYHTNRLLDITMDLLDKRNLLLRRKVISRGFMNQQEEA